MKFRRKLGQKEGVGGIEVTPLLDAAFILIIFLLVSTAFKKEENAFDIELPRSSNQEVIVERSSVTLFITKAGSYSISVPNQFTRQVDLTEVGATISDALGEERQNPVSLVIDEGTPYNHIVGAIGALRKVGVTNIQLPFETESPESLNQN